jgi:hypothetical protein
MTESVEKLLLTYILAKDGNRPHLLRQVFAEDAQLEIVLNTDAISFPPNTRSLDSIADIAVRQLGATYENIYTFYLGRPAPGHRLEDFSCGWLLGMTAKASGDVRVGYGRYDWRFSGTWLRVERLRITIQAMQILPSAFSDTVLDWLAGLPYPWCAADRFVRTAPEIDALQPLIAWLKAAGGPAMAN